MMFQLTGCATITSAEMVLTEMETGTGSGSVIPVNLDQSINEAEPPLNHINSIKVSSAAIRIVRPKSHALPLAKRRLLLRRDSNSTKPISNGAQVIVTQYFEE